MYSDTITAKETTARAYDSTVFHFLADSDSGFI